MHAIVSSTEVAKTWRHSWRRLEPVVGKLTYLFRWSCEARLIPCMQDLRKALLRVS